MEAIGVRTGNGFFRALVGVAFELRIAYPIRTVMAGHDELK
jgi:hypothetical protein